MIGDMPHSLSKRSLLSPRVVWPTLIVLATIGMVVIWSVAMIEAGQQSGNGIAVMFALREYAEQHNGSYPAQLRDEAFLRSLSERPRRYIATSKVLYIPPGPASSQSSPVLLFLGYLNVRVVTLDGKCYSLRNLKTVHQTEPNP